MIIDFAPLYRQRVLFLLHCHQFRVIWSKSINFFSLVSTHIPVWRWPRIRVLSKNKLWCKFVHRSFRPIHLCTSVGLISLKMCWLLLKVCSDLTVIHAWDDKHRVADTRWVTSQPTEWRENQTMVRFVWVNINKRFNLHRNRWFWTKCLRVIACRWSLLIIKKRLAIVKAHFCQFVWNQRTYHVLTHVNIHTIW